MTSTWSLGRMRRPAAVSSLILVEMARMPGGRIAASTPPWPALISLCAVIGSPAMIGARAIAPDRSRMAAMPADFVMKPPVTASVGHVCQRKWLSLAIWPRPMSVRATSTSVALTCTSTCFCGCGLLTIPFMRTNASTPAAPAIGNADHLSSFHRASSPRPQDSPCERLCAIIVNEELSGVPDRRRRTLRQLAKAANQGVAG